MTETTIRPFSVSSYRAFIDEHKLMGTHCMDCGSMHLPPRAICPSCRSSNIEWAAFSGNGKLAAFTVVYIAPSFMSDAGFGRNNPYLTGIVELQEGVKISARLLGFDPLQPESIRIGTPVEVEFIQEGPPENARVVLGFKP